jgi:hypothetical protein
VENFLKKDGKMLIYFRSFWNILWTFGIFYYHLVLFVFIWYIFPVLLSCTKKNLATLLRTAAITVITFIGLCVIAVILFPQNLQWMAHTYIHTYVDICAVGSATRLGDTFWRWAQFLLLNRSMVSAQFFQKKTRKKFTVIRDKF